MAQCEHAWIHGAASTWCRKCRFVPAEEIARIKINLAQQNQASTLPDRAVFAHLSSVTPSVKSGKTRVSPFNRASRSARFGKSADPTCYNVPVGGNSAAALFGIDRRMT